MFDKTIEGYQELSEDYGFLSYTKPSIKTSLFSTGLTYMGYAGYLNPFTNEGQVNGLLPNFRFPIVAGHEIGHQLGYSAENETNFIGYLVTANSSDPYFQYAAYAYALGYCLSDIRRGDPAVFDEMFNGLHLVFAKILKKCPFFGTSTKILWNRYLSPFLILFLRPIIKRKVSKVIMR